MAILGGVVLTVIVVAGLAGLALLVLLAKGMSH